MFVRVLYLECVNEQRYVKNNTGIYDKNLFYFVLRLRIKIIFVNRFDYTNLLNSMKSSSIV